MSYVVAAATLVISVVTFVVQVANPSDEEKSEIIADKANASASSIPKNTDQEIVEKADSEVIVGDVQTDKFSSDEIRLMREEIFAQDGTGIDKDIAMYKSYPPEVLGKLYEENDMVAAIAVSEMAFYLGNYENAKKFAYQAITLGSMRSYLMFCLTLEKTGYGDIAGGSREASMEALAAYTAMVYEGNIAGIDWGETIIRNNDEFTSEDMDHVLERAEQFINQLHQNRQSQGIVVNRVYGQYRKEELVRVSNILLDIANTKWAKKVLKNVIEKNK